MDSLHISAPENDLELIDALKAVTENSKLLAGGTDLIIALHQGKVMPDLVVDLSGIKEFAVIREENGRVEIGTISTFSQIQENVLVKKYGRCLAEAASQVGSVQIRNRATLGGNIANASPAADSIPPLLVLEAEIKTVDSQGTVEKVPLPMLLKGAGQTVLRSDQVITAISFSIPGPYFMSTFAKLGTRSAVTIARISLALGVEYDVKTNAISTARIALGAVGKTAFRTPRVEKFLQGKKVSEQLALEFADQLSAEIELAIPGRYSLPYKKEAIRGLAWDVFRKIFSNCIAE